VITVPKNSCTIHLSMMLLANYRTWIGY